eukprot:564112-Rhodomonas_salina.4
MAQSTVTTRNHQLSRIYKWPGIRTRSRSRAVDLPVSCTLAYALRCASLLLSLSSSSTICS